MEKQEVEKCPTVEDAGLLNRNRSFKSKQLVRSLAIRESASPPRSVSPAARECERERCNTVNVKLMAGADRSPSHSSQEGDQRKPLQIQITQGARQCESAGAAGGRGARPSSDLLSNNPRVACVCGACAPCPHCRGRRRRHIGSVHKQDSGIGADECLDCDTNGQCHTGCGTGGVVVHKASSSLDAEEYCRCPERRERTRHAFTRTDSEEPTGHELVEFISETLNKNAKDRAALLKIEKELHALVNDAGRCIVKFPVMTSYGRMLVHRCAALFQLSHHLDQYNKYCVIVSKAGTSGGRIPCTSFKSWCVTSFPPASPARAPPDPATHPHQAKSILKRACGEAAGREGGALVARSKSLEQREQDYERARRRIFSQDNSSEESPWAGLGAGPVKLLTPDHARNKLLKVQSLETGSSAGSWRARGGGAVAKSHSFGGYTEPQHHTRALSRQGDLASSSWRLSPSSSGYKTLSLRSTDSVTPSPTGGGTPEPAGGAVAGPAVPAPASGGAVVWAVTDMARVPPGVTVIHPQTGRPLTNPDGSLYRFDPDNPPHVYETTPVPATTTAPAIASHHQSESSCETRRRRGRLEKQQSFLDHETESPLAEQFHYSYEVQHDEQSAQQHKTSSPAQCPPAPPPPAHLYQGTVYYSPQLYTQQYEQEVQSPPQLSQYMPELSAAGAPLGKATPLLEHNLRNMVLSNNVVYGAPAATAVPSAYQYVQHAPCRIEAVAPLYGAGTPALEEQKVLSPPGNTFRIDASYPYPPIEYSSYAEPPAGPALAPPPSAGPLHQRSYSVGYGGELAPAAPYPVYGVPWTMPFGPPLLGGPPVRSPHAPLLYPHHYNTLLYPQMVPQYPVCAPVFSTPAPRAPTPPSAELRAGPTSSPPQGAPAYRSVRNNGHGILGRYPQHTSSEVQLTGAARAIVNSIRQLQANHTYHSQDRRYEYRDRERTDRRPDGRGDGQTDRHAHKHSYTHIDRHNYQQDRNNYQDRNDNTQQGSNQEKNHIQERNSHIQEKSNFQDRNSHAQDRNSNALDANNVPDRNNYSDRNSNVQDKTQDRSIVEDRARQDRNSCQERNYRNYQQTNQHCHDNAQNNRDNNTKDIHLEKNDKAEICPDNTKDKVEVQSNAQDSANNVQDESQNTQDRGNAQDRTAGNAADVSNAQERSNVQERSPNAQERHSYQDSRIPERGGYHRGERKYPPHRAPRPPLHHYRPHYLFRQMSPGTWCRRAAPAPAPAPASTPPLHPGVAHPRRPHPDTRHPRRY